MLKKELTHIIYNNSLDAETFKTLDSQLKQSRRASGTSSSEAIEYLNGVKRIGIFNGHIIYPSVYDGLYFEFDGSIYLRERFKT